VRSPRPANLAERLAAVDWSQLETAYGRADGPHALEGSGSERWGSVPEQLSRLWSDERETRLAATHQLWCCLCHQHAYVSSAALPALPFLLEALDGADDALAIELLDIFAGIASCAAAGRAPSAPWLRDLRAALVMSRARFDGLSSHPNAEVRDWAECIVVHIDSLAREG
jgi:hypothetical protein